MPDFVRACGLVTAHGEGVRVFTHGLKRGIAPVRSISSEPWPVSPNGRNDAFYAPGPRGGAVRELLAKRLLTAWEEARAAMPSAERAAMEGDCALLFASTKGCVEDFVWKSAEGDPYSPVMEEFLRHSRLKPRRWLTVSNACASSHTAIQLARDWLGRGVARYALVLAADFVGPFVLQGFHSLGALSPTMARPFDGGRDGLLLGEAAGAVVLSREGSGPALLGTAVDCEGHAVTRPESSAGSLQRAIRAALAGREPGAVIAHGTATPANDRAEDQAFSLTLPHRPWVTGTKGSVGHTLGASGLVDLVAACEWLAGGGGFPITGCRAPDPAFRSRFLLGGENVRARSVLVTALGFGGVHAAFHVGES